MSELKVIDLGNIRESIEKDEPVYYEYYAKSEADKVIANRDYEIKKLKDTIGKLLKAKTEQIIDEVMQKALIYGDGFVRVEDMMKLIAELHHQKYKRCLAMAGACYSKSERMYCEAYVAKAQNEIIGKEPKDAVVKKFELWGAIASTHRKIWLALAEEPTWAKFLQLIHKEEEE